MEETLPALLTSELGIELSPGISMDELKQKLSSHINYLIQKDFNQLLSILYRIDVHENKLKALLHDNSETDASMIIADSIIERQLQKLKSRKEQTPRDNNIDENEKW